MSDFGSPKLHVPHNNTVPQIVHVTHQKSHGNYRVPRTIYQVIIHLDAIRTSQRLILYTNPR